MKKIKELIVGLYENDVIRYIFFGACTTLVNLVVFYVMRKVGAGLNTANVISIITAILFAYVVNSKFVFQDKCRTLKDHIQPFCKFISARLVTMVIEVGGVWLLAEILRMSDSIVVMCEGKKTGELDISEATQENIMNMATREIN